MAKRKLEIEDVEDMKEPVPTASVHGIIQTISPIKKGQSSDYFEGKFLFNDHSQKFVGFKKHQQTKLKQLMDEHQPVHLDDCEVKKAKRGNSMNILLKFNYQEDITLNALDSKDLYEKVNVKVKIIQISDTTTTSTGKETKK